MTKREFDDFITESLRGMTLEEQEIYLRKLHGWITRRQEKLSERIRKSYIKCNKCKKYLLRTKPTIVHQYEMKQGECIWRDSGNGDDDIFADVTYDVYYYICPYCGAKIEKTRYAIKEENKRNRYGDLL